MKHTNKQQNRRFLVCPYLFALFTVGTILLFICIGIIAFIRIPVYSSMDLTSIIFECVFVGCVPFGFCVAYLMDAYQYWGFHKLTETEWVISAPLRRTIRLEYTDIKCIGIDYAVVNGMRQFWIYASTNDDSPRKAGKINKITIDHQFVRVIYSEKVFLNLLTHLPPKMRKQLQNGQTVLRVYNYSE